MQIEGEAIPYVLQDDKTAVWFDAREAEAFAAGSLPGARNLEK